MDEIQSALGGLLLDADVVAAGPHCKLAWKRDRSIVVYFTLSLHIGVGIL